MTTQTDVYDVMFCDSCGASVYREHIDRGLAGRWAGQLLCPHCLTEKRGGGQDLEHISKADDPEGGSGPGRSTTHTGMAALGDLDTVQYRRTLLPAGHGASRVRIFHCKLSDGPMAQMNKQVNEWLDQHADFEVKFATTTIGTWEGRHSEQHLILTLYY